MQLTAWKMTEWFVPRGSSLIQEDMAGEKTTQDIFDNLINPAIQTLGTPPQSEDSILESADDNAGTGYRANERDSLENKLLQLDSIEIEE
jgi:hypothetical protein